jgi:hypothetical protein
MSEDKTAETPDPRTFEERVFARFDSLDARLYDVEIRLVRLEAKDFDTKPIWERALAELIELNQHVANIERKIDVLGKDMIQLRADQAHVESRLDNLESR